MRTDDNLIEAGNSFEGLRFAVGDGALRKPKHWLQAAQPVHPVVGRALHPDRAPHARRGEQGAGRGGRARGGLRLHQLPVWTLRRFLQGDRLWHDPRRRQCSLASLTSLVYVGDTLVDIVYSEPAGASDPTVTGA